MHNKKELIKATLIFSVLSIMQPLSNFLLLPVYTKYLSLQQYGYFSILNNVAVFFSIISGLNIATAIVAFYKSYKNHESLRRFIGNVITFSIYCNLVLFLAICLWGDGFSNLVFKENIPFFPNVFYAIAYGMISSIFLSYFNYLKYQKRLKQFALLSILQFLVLMILQYFFIAVFKENITGALLSRLIAVAIILSITLYLNRQYIFRKIDYVNNIIPQLKYSIITGPAVLIGWLASYIDRFIIEHRTTSSEMLGQYSFLATVCAIAELGVYALSAAFQPYVFDSYVTADQRAVRNYYRIFIGGVILATSGLILASPLFQYLIHNESLVSILSMVPIMAVGYVFFGVASMYGMQITFARKSVYYLGTYGSALIINLLLNVLLIDRLGILGIIISSFFTKFMLGISMVYFAQRSFRTHALKPVMILSFIFAINVIAFWSLSYAGYISLKIAVILQFVVSCLIVYLAVKPRMLQQFIIKNIQRNN